MMFAAAYSSLGADDRHLRHVRAIDPRFETVIADGARRSAHFRSLLGRLNRSTVYVYVGYGLLPAGLRGRLTLAGTGNVWRYLRVEVECRQSTTGQIVSLAHELQHAVEIADAADTVDQPSLRALYGTIGFETDGGHRQFETEAARRAGYRVQQELSSRRSDNLVVVPVDLDMIVAH
jgi:hypothetical protein